jgi:hypothetical protein
MKKAAFPRSKVESEKRFEFSFSKAPAPAATTLYNPTEPAATASTPEINAGQQDACALSCLFYLLFSKYYT